jgi:predicted ATPase
MGLRALQEGGSQTFYTVFLTGLAEVLLSMDELEESLVVADEAEQVNAPWWMPEALRIKREILRSQESSTDLAIDSFRQSLDLARHQGALSWELRAGTSLAGLLRDQGHLPDAIGLLKPIFNRFTEGFDTADLKAAKALLDTLV